MPRLNVHPTTLLIVWLLLLLGVQCLNGIALAAAFLLLPALGMAVLRRGVKLVWRTRWLLVSLLIVFAWGVAGEPLWDGPLAATREGLREASTHIGRLLLVLIAVAAFLEAMPLADLLAALRGLLGPLRYLGCDADRGVIRLMLVLRYVETLPRPRDWRTLLDIPAGTACEVLEVNQDRLRWSDHLIYTSAAIVVALFCFR